MAHGTWHIADFGNCRFEDAETSTNTMAEFKTPAYAAPEQWKREATSIKTDVYALGCILFELLTKRPPFEGRQVRELHLTEKPPLVDDVSPETNRTIAAMLMKTPDRRPSPEEIFANNNGNEEADVFSKLRATASKLQQEKEESEIAEKATEDVAAQKTAQVNDATTWLCDDLISPFLSQLGTALSGVGKRSDWGIEVPSKAKLIFNPPFEVSSSFQSGGWDVIAESSIEIVRLDNNYSWGHSLFYGKRAHSNDPYAWHEIGFRQSGSMDASSNRDMFHLYQNAGMASVALGGTIARRGVGFGPFNVEKDLDQFFERWGNLLSRAIEGKLKTTPIFPPSGGWWK